MTSDPLGCLISKPQTTPAASPPIRPVSRLDMRAFRVYAGIVSDLEIRISCFRRATSTAGCRARVTNKPNFRRFWTKNADPAQKTNPIKPSSRMLGIRAGYPPSAGPVAPNKPNFPSLGIALRRFKKGVCEMTGRMPWVKKQTQTNPIPVAMAFCPGLEPPLHPLDPVPHRGGRP